MNQKSCFAVWITKNRGQHKPFSWGPSSVSRGEVGVLSLNFPELIKWIIEEREVKSSQKFLRKTFHKNPWNMMKSHPSM